jgi:starch phosphorylase
VIQVPFIEPPIFVAVWRVNVGKVPLYLLDTDIPANCWKTGPSPIVFTQSELNNVCSRR